MRKYLLWKTGMKGSVTALALSSMLVGCGGGGSDDSPAAPSAAVETREIVAASDAGGTLSYSFTVGDDAGASQLIVSAPELIDLSLVGVARDGEIVRLEELPGTPAIDPKREILTVGLGERPGNYTVTVRTTRNRRNVIGAICRGVLVERVGPSSPGAVVPVNLIFAGPTQDSEESIDATYHAVEIAQSLLGAADVTLNIEEYHLAGPSVLPDPTIGDPLYTFYSSSSRPYAVNLVIGGQIAGARLPDYKYGISPSVPGPAVPGPNSAITVSILRLTGGDGVFNSDDPFTRQEHDDEIRLFGEEVARLIAHYLGVPDIVEFRGGRVVAADHFDDTPSCVVESECRNEDSVRSNLMFPYPLRQFYEDSDTFFRRTYLSAAQRREIRRSVLVR